MTPQKANTQKKMLQLKRDNTSTPKYWFMVEQDTVTLSAQRNGAPRTQVIHISKKAFDKFIKFYTTEQSKHQQ